VDLFKALEFLSRSLDLGGWIAHIKLYDFRASVGASFCDIKGDRYVAA
jgi:hypothetical protein